MRNPFSGLRRTLTATVLLVFGIATSVPANPVFNGGNGTVVFGVTPYGPPTPAVPTYLANNFTLRNDILTSPGAGTLNNYNTANPIVANNIFSLGPLGLPVAGFQIGGGNGNGAFGAGTIVNTGPLIGYALADAGPVGGTASYGITSEIAQWTNVGNVVPAGTKYGDWITMGGAVPLIGNADVVALRVFLTDTAGVFGAGLDLPQLVLAISRNGAGNTIANYNIVAIGGSAAALILDNGNTGAFRAAAVNNLNLPANMPIGDVITVTATFTGYADPASFSTFDLTTQPDLLAAVGPLPGISFVNTTNAIPEPASIVLSGLGLLGVVGCCARRWRKHAAHGNVSVEMNA
jgi:hypothetical protein